MRRLMAMATAALLAVAGVLIAAPAHAAPISGPTGPVAVLGTPLVGEELTLDLTSSQFTPASGNSFVVEWRQVSTNAVVQTNPGPALDTSLQLTTARGGQQFYATITVTNGVNQFVLYSVFTNVIAFPDLPGAGTTPDLVGTFVVGDPITTTFDAAAITALPGGTVSYQWWDAMAGAPLGGETGASFTPTAAHVGVAPYAVISASATERAPLTLQTTIPGTVRAPYWAEGDPAPGLVGSFAPGEPISVDFDAAAVTTAGGTVSYQWWDATASAPLGGETGATFTPSLAQLGVSPYVVISVTAPGYAATVIQSTIPRSVALGEWTQVTAPSIPSTAIVGDTLTVEPGTYSPSATSYTYQWYLSDGTALAGETDPSIVLDSTLRGEQLYVTETPVRAGYESALWSSNLSDAVRYPFYPPVGATPALTGTFFPDQPISVQFDAAAVDALGGTVDYQWWDATTNTPLAGETGAAFTPTAAQLGVAPYVLITVNAPGFETTVIQSTIPRVVEQGVFEVVDAPSIAGTAAVGSTLTATPAVVLPAATSSTFQWFRADGTIITGATSTTLVVTAALAGQGVYVVETVGRDGYADAEVASALTAVVPGAALAATGSGILAPWFALALLVAGGLLLTRRAASRR